MTEQHKPQNNTDSAAQNELNLEFNQMEPITPKKHITHEPSLLDKAKALMEGLGKKEQATEQAEPVIAETTTSNEQKNVEESLAEENTQTQNEPAPISKINKPERWAILGFIPAKYRRIFIVLLLAVIILLIISWLKPSADTVNAFEQPSNSIPTQFQSLNQEQPLENNVLDNLNQGQQPAQQADAQNTQSNNENAQTATTASAENNADNAQSNPATSPEPVAQPSPQTEQPVPAVKPQPTSVEPKPVVDTAKTASKPATQTTPKAQPKPVVKATTQTTNTSKPKAENKAQTVKKVEAKVEKKVPVVEAKPATSKTAGTSKTLTIPQGVSLMQVFRDNNLNISDVNAMTKANGAGNALSSFKPGDKVQISVNSQGRVQQLRLANGSTFIRQANGTYQYKK
ncbi:hypothetical protein L4F91_02900 [Avibacterium sp. 20-126]|uniref:LysM-like peptidoglycan-binding domain-containing protein n=1 Tax=Avibacterium sp. 20-126 TaxID=2911524 RepID=UPI00218B3B79|nr:hypothetical protein L4F91_02900 [Avibacterium sp. 20-126]